LRPGNSPQVFIRYASSMLGAEGKQVVFEGIAHFVLRDGRIARYCEVFDRGLALVQQGFAAERIKRVLEKSRGPAERHAGMPGPPRAIRGRDAADVIRMTWIGIWI